MRDITNDIEKVLFTEEQIQAKVAELGRQITTDYSDEDLIVVGILKGAGIFMSDLIRRIDGPVRIDYMMISSYGSSTVSTGIVRILKDLDYDIHGCSVLIVEDLVDTGYTLNYLQDYLYRRGAKDVRICTLLDKPARRQKTVTVDYLGFEAPDAFIVGYGIDYAEYYRNLPFIGVLKPEIIE
ncbi:MAG: hypoxanthine phosphoribosyltransferase [Solobacterium sp.]|nr:hypoxanthine phosphoribosyltransferase [Solobacterium sp.]